MDFIGLQRLNVPASSAGWPSPAQAVYIDTTKAVDAGGVHYLPAAETVRFESVSDVSGLERVSAQNAIQELSIEHVRSLGEGTDVWANRADRIQVEGKPNVMKWFAEARPTRSDNWADTWVFGDAFRF